MEWKHFTKMVIRLRSFSVSLLSAGFVVSATCTLTSAGWNTDWLSLGGIVTSAPALSSQADGRLDVWALGQDSKVWHRALVSADWFGWENGAGGPPGGARSAPAAFSRGRGTVDLVVVGSDGGLWRRSWNDATGWANYSSSVEGWERLGKPENVRLQFEPTLSSQQPGRLCLGSA